MVRRLVEPFRPLQTRKQDLGQCPGVIKVIRQPLPRQGGGGEAREGKGGERPVREQAGAMLSWERDGACERGRKGGREGGSVQVSIRSKSRMNTLSLLKSASRPPTPPISLPPSLPPLPSTYPSTNPKAEGPTARQHLPLARCPPTRPRSGGDRKGGRKGGGRSGGGMPGRGRRRRSPGHLRGRRLPFGRGACG